MPKQMFLILGKLGKLDVRPSFCEILHCRMLPRVLANKMIFINDKLIVNLVCLFFEMQFYSATTLED